MPARARAFTAVACCFCCAPCGARRPRACPCARARGRNANSCVRPFCIPRTTLLACQRCPRERPAGDCRAAGRSGRGAHAGHRGRVARIRCGQRRQSARRAQLAQHCARTRSHALTLQRDRSPPCIRRWASAAALPNTLPRQYIGHDKHPSRLQSAHDSESTITSYCVRHVNFLADVDSRKTN